MSRHALLLCAALAALPAVSTAAAEMPPRVQAFDAGWRMNVGDRPGAESPGFDDAAWAAVTLPRAFNEDQAFRDASENQKEAIVWYRKRFVLPPSQQAGGRVFLEFDGVRQAADVFINGTKAGFHENGVSAFGVDATPYLKPAPFENVVAVRVDNSWTYKERATGSAFQWNNKNFYANYGGINRTVRLHLTGPLHQTLPLYSSLGTTGVYIWADGFDVAGRAATIHAESQVRNAGDRPRTFSYRVALRDVDGRPAGAFTGPTVTLAPGETRTVSAQARLKGLRFWSWGYGYLYAVSTALVENGAVVDEVTTRTGFRKTDFRDGMVRLNDRVIQVHGYAQRSTNEWPNLGTDAPPWLSDFSNRLMVESNGNLVRWMHVTPARQDVTSADRVGLMQALPAGDAEGDVTGRRWEQRVEAMRDAVVAYRNSPSVIFYESGNDNISEAHMAEMKAVRDQFDPHGGRAIGSREMLDSQIAEYGGEMLYINKSAGKPVWAMEYMRDEAARKFQDALTPPFHRDSPDYNRNQDSYAVEAARRWYDYWRVRPGSGTRVSSGGVNIGFTDSNTHFRGDNNYRRSGEVDAMRLPKEAFFVHQVMWDGWVDVEKPAAHIVGHWNYAPGTVKDVVVVSSSDKVELKLNGRSLGSGVQTDRFIFTFPEVAWAPGRLEAVGYDRKGRVVATASMETTGAPAGLKLTPRTGPAGWRADGSDVALVDVEVVDGQGRRVPTALNVVRFDLAGPVDWRGGIAQGDSAGKAPAQTSGQAVNVMIQAAGKDAVTHYEGANRGDDNFIGARTLPVEAGVNRVALRSTLTPGKVTVTASAEGLASARVTLDVAPPPPPHGQLVGGDLLPVSLSRGPTPAGPSFHVWRHQVRPIETTAGSNADSVRLAQDDNEMTHWSSAKDLSKAWIEWRLDQPRTLDELELKLIGWRIRSYPLRVTVDGVTVYDGVAPKTLGYAVLPLKPVKGSRIRLSLTAGTEDRDAFGNIVEITGARAGLDTGAEKVPSGSALGIVEAELYERLDARSR